MKRFILFGLMACVALLIQSCSKNEHIIPAQSLNRPKQTEGIPGGASSGVLPTGTYKFLTYVSTFDPATNKYVGVVGGSTAPGALIEQRDYAGPVQEWRITQDGFGTYSIINYNSGLAIDDLNYGQGDNNPIQQMTYSGNTAQEWVIEYQAFGLYRIESMVNRAMGLHVYGGSTANGANIVLKTFMSGTTQNWGYLLAYPMPISNPPATIYTPDANHTDSYPRVTRLNNGNLLASFNLDSASGFAHNVAKFYTSTNGGTSWTATSTLTDTHRGQGINDATPYVTPITLGSLPAGTLLCGVRSMFWVSASYIDVYKSTDNGVTWSYLSSVASGTGFGKNVYEPFFLVNSSNQLVCYYSDERDAAHSQKLSSQTSTDGGSTWGSQVNVVALPTQTDRPGMFQAAKMGNGSWMMTYEYVGAPNISQVFYKTSTDGQNWSGGSGTPGTGIKTISGETPGGTPTIVWTPAGSATGTVIITSLADYPSNSRGSDNIINFNYGTGNWISLPQPLTYNYTSDNVSGYSRNIGLSADGKTLYHINCVSTNDKNAKTEFVATTAW